MSTGEAFLLSKPLDVCNMRSPMLLGNILFSVSKRLEQQKSLHCIDMFYTSCRHRQRPRRIVDRVGGTFSDVIAGAPLCKEVDVPVKKVLLVVAKIYHDRSYTSVEFFGSRPFFESRDEKLTLQRRLPQVRSRYSARQTWIVSNPP